MLLKRRLATHDEILEQLEEKNGELAHVNHTLVRVCEQLIKTNDELKKKVDDVLTFLEASLDSEDETPPSKRVKTWPVDKFSEFPPAVVEIDEM